MLKVEHVTKYYGDFKAVDDLSFEVDKGEIIGLLGVNGAGKTTTFRMIMGLLDMTEGKITFNNKKIDYNVTDKIGFLTEERSLLTKLTVREQVLYYGNLKGMYDKEIIEKVEKLLKEFEIEDYMDKKIKELSKGNQQKIQFITAIMNDPKLLILDEPFSGLDPLNVEMFKKKIIELSNKGCSIIFSSHRMEHVELFCNKIVVLLRGKTVLSGSIKDIKESYQKKNIFIKGNIDKDEMLKIKGVLEVNKLHDEYEVKIESIDIVSKVFDKLKNKEIYKFVVEEPTLNEIFLETVGEKYEK